MKAFLSLVVMFLVTMSATWLPTQVAEAAQPEVNVSKSGKTAIHGHDPVAYFTDGKPMEGSPEFTATYKGVTWHFVSAENRDRFKANPAAYAPQYGGYCAYAAARGYFADADPNAWRIEGGKLYLNYNKRVQGLWQSEMKANISKADRNWPGMIGQ